MVATSAGKYEGLYFGMLALLLVVTVSLGVVRQRRIQRNVALLTEGAVSQ